MKTPKLITGTIAVLLFTNFLFAENPTNKDYTKNLADNMVKGLCKDINLTDSQKLAVQTIAKEYERQFLSIKQQANPELKKTINKQAVLTYRNELNNILTKEQIDTLNTRRIERLKFRHSNNTKK